ncbi:hypothetical protein [uncultured Tateyamaria sp.]|uniref:hypothetical protein n=1 Tax=uncultured Tateyamaria sp. TaxID=455651 RepID=UPI00260E4093|nr:hypothetical protein [uncultured Tateyamaria sp.]
MTGRQEPRSWRLPAQGDVIFDAPCYEPKLEALTCLSSALRDNIRLTLPNWRPGKDIPEQSLSLRYDLMSATWRSSSGSAPGAALIQFKSLLEKRLDEAAITLNTALQAPQNAQKRLIELTPVYDGGLSFDRPKLAAGQPLRNWRRSDAGWIAQSLVPDPSPPDHPPDIFEAVMRLLSRLDRPGELLWTLPELGERVVHMHLFSTPCLQYMIPRLRRRNTILLEDTWTSAADHQKFILLSELFAAAQAIRLFAADRAGKVILSAYEVDDLNAPNTDAPVLQLQVAPSAWLTSLGAVSHQRSSDLMRIQMSDLRVVTHEQNDWVPCEKSD